MAAPRPVSVREKLDEFSDHWNPRIIGKYNGNEVRIAKVQGEFTWHSHDETDELFFVVSGKLTIAFRDRTEYLEAGEMLIVPKGTEHCPSAEEECHIMMMDREGEPNTGGQPSHMTRERLTSI